MKSLLFLSLALTPLCAFAAPITVRVVDEAGAPIEGAMVQIRRVDKDTPLFVVETTDAQGVAKTELGASKFSAAYFGQATAWKAGRALTGGNLFDLKDGTLTLTLRAGTMVSGTVEDENGPVEGALVTLDFVSAANNYVRLAADAPLAQKLSARSDAQGCFTLDGVPAEANLSLRITGDKYASQTIRMESGDASAKVNLRPGAKLRGRVLAVDGAPLAGVKVFAVNRNDKSNPNPALAVSDADGNYLLSGLEGGAYNVLFVPAPDADYAIAARQNEGAVAGAMRDLETARAVAGVVVRGRVVDADSKAGVKNIAVVVYGPAQPESSDYFRVQTTDENGDFSARVVPGANSFVVANAPPEWDSAQSKIDLDIRQDAAAPAATLQLKPTIPLRGRFVDKDGNGVQTKLAITQKHREQPLESDENGDFKIYGLNKGEAKIGRSMFDFGEEDATPMWEIEREQTVELPATEPLRIVMRRVQLSALNGTVQDENGAPIEGVKLNVSIANGEGIGSTMRFKTVTSDAQGRFDLPDVRADQIVKLRGIEKTGYDLDSGGEISKNGDNWKVQTVKMRARKSQLAGRITLADGESAANALVFAEGSATRADAQGHYVLKVLPSGKVDVFAYAASQFNWKNAPTFVAGNAAGDAATTIDLKLAPQALQPTDRDLASEMMMRAKVLAVQINYGDMNGLKLSDDSAEADNALETLIAAPNDDRLTRAIYLGASNPDVSTELLLRAVRAVPDARWRLYAATMLFARRNDWPDDNATRALAAALSRDAQTIAADEKAPNQWISAIGLINVAPLIERFEGEAAGKAALARGIDWIKTQFPQPGNGYTDGYLSALAANAESVAANSPALFAQLLDAIDVTSPAYSRSLQEGLVAIAKARGLEAAAPFLRRLSDAPNARADENGGVFSANTQARTATRQAIEAGGLSAPALALQLARGLGASPEDGIENEAARALAQAAFFQAPAVAAGLWKESLPKLSADRAAQIAVRVAQTQPALGAELLDLARQQLEADDDGIDSQGASLVAAFAFYEAKLDAAQARYRLEKAWWQAQGKSDEFGIRPDLVRAMATIDGERAFEWAMLLPAGDNQNDNQYDARIGALANAVRYIEASARQRAHLDFERWRHDSTVFAD